MAIFLVPALWTKLLALTVVAIPFFTTRRFTFAILAGFALLAVYIGLFGDWPALVLYTLAVDLFLLARNLPCIKRVLAKITMKDIIGDSQYKKAR